MLLIYHTVKMFLKGHNLKHVQCKTYAYVCIINNITSDCHIIIIYWEHFKQSDDAKIIHENEESAVWIQFFSHAADDWKADDENESFNVSGL